MLYDYFNRVEYPFICSVTKEYVNPVESFVVIPVADSSPNSEKNDWVSNADQFWIFNVKERSRKMKSNVAMKNAILSLVLVMMVNIVMNRFFGYDLPVQCGPGINDYHWNNNSYWSPRRYPANSIERTSEYILMADGQTSLAADVYLSSKAREAGHRLPTIVHFTRFGRSYERLGRWLDVMFWISVNEYLTIREYLWIYNIHTYVQMNTSVNIWIWSEYDLNIFIHTYVQMNTSVNICE